MASNDCFGPVEFGPAPQSGRRSEWWGDSTSRNPPCRLLASISTLFATADYEDDLFATPHRTARRSVAGVSGMDGASHATKMSSRRDATSQTELPALTETRPVARSVRSIGIQVELAATDATAASAGGGDRAGRHSPGASSCKTAATFQASQYDQLLAGAIALPALDDRIVRKTARRNMPPEKAAFLKAWMLSPEHIHKPYPTDEEKDALAVKLGISVRQLSTWFTNARKRMWKPLVACGHVTPRPGDDEAPGCAASQRPKRHCAARSRRRGVVTRRLSASSSRSEASSSDSSTVASSHEEGDTSGSEAE